MKNFNLVKKTTILSILLLCLGWATFNQNGVAANQTTCEECLDEYAACVQECGGPGNQPCLQNCANARHQCFLHCY